MSIVTKTGDKGETSFFGGERVSKSNSRLAAYGEVDELNSAIGVLAALPRLPVEINEDLEIIQKICFTIGSELATPSSAGAAAKSYIPRVSGSDLDFLEKRIIFMEKSVPPQRKFILPGGSPAAAAAFWVRAVARRAERGVVALGPAQGIRPELLSYLNRLSDYFFILGRFLNFQSQIEEQEWAGGQEG